MPPLFTLILEGFTLLVPRHFVRGNLQFFRRRRLYPSIFLLTFDFFRSMHNRKRLDTPVLFFLVYSLSSSPYRDYAAAGDAYASPIFASAQMPFLPIDCAPSAANPFLFTSFTEMRPQLPSFDIVPFLVDFKSNQIISFPQKGGGRVAVAHCFRATSAELTVVARLGAISASALPGPLSPFPCSTRYNGFPAMSFSTPGSAR